MTIYFHNREKYSFYFLERNILNHLSLPDSWYIVKDTQRKTLRAQWLGFLASYCWSHQRNTSTSTLDTKFHTSVMKEAVIFKQRDKKLVQTQDVWESKSLVLAGRDGTGAVYFMALRTDSVHLREELLTVHTCSLALRDWISFELSFAAPHAQSLYLKTRAAQEAALRKIQNISESV